MATPGTETERERDETRSLSYQVSGKIFKERTKTERGREGEGLGFQERYSVISKCFFALSGCLTKAGGEFHWRIRLVAFLWPLTSGGFGLCLESQWSNRHVCHFVEQSIDCGRGNNASSSFFFFIFYIYIYFGGLFMLWLIVLHSRAAVRCSLSFLEAPGWRMYVRFHMSSWKETKLFVGGFCFRKSPANSLLYLSPRWIY